MIPTEAQCRKAYQFAMNQLVGIRAKAMHKATKARNVSVDQVWKSYETVVQQIEKQHNLDMTKAGQQFDEAMKNARKDPQEEDK